MEDALSIVLGSLEDVPYKKVTATNVSICCPFHDERTPSCSINIDPSSRFPVGTFHCWGCGAKGTWNELAKHMGFQRIERCNDFSVNNIDTLRLLQKVKPLNEVATSHERLLAAIGKGAVRWPAHRSWRGYDGSLLHKLGYMYDDPKEDQIMLALAVNVFGRYYGGVKAFLSKPKYGPSYINTSGTWVMDYGLLGFDYLRSVKNFGYDSVILVEGPRDWLRLTYEALPALAILGSKLFSPKKLDLILMSGIKRIYTMPDNDVSGDTMHVKIRDICQRKNVPCDVLQLPKQVDADGQLIKLDPDNAPDYMIDNVRRVLDKSQAQKRGAVSSPSSIIKRATSRFSSARSRTRPNS